MVDYLDKSFDVRDTPMWFHKQGLQETQTGYGSRLRSTRMIRIHGEKVWRRVYIIQYSNAGTAYVRVKGQPKYLRDSDF